MARRPGSRYARVAAADPAVRLPVAAGLERLGGLPKTKPPEPDPEALLSG
jgi:hypothetical protein